MPEYPDILTLFAESKSKRFQEKLGGKTPIFVCTIATTETAKIPGISAAGKNPDLTDYTPPADTEYLYYGRCRCIDGVPVTPDGIPTPALITRSAANLSQIPMIVADAGSRIKPQIPFFNLGGQPGADIRTGHAVENATRVFERAIIVGRNLAGASDYVVLGESIAGGTTTALAVLLAMGFDAKGKVSSSMPMNPHNLKLSVVRQAMKTAGIDEGGLRENPLQAISKVGDPTQAAIAGLVIGAAKETPTILAGGTQMAAVLAIVNEIDSSVMDNLSIGTTRWLAKDHDSDIVGLVRQVEDIPIMAANLDFGTSKHQGLRAYETGIVKEGVGAGGMSISAMLSTKGAVTGTSLREQIEEEYERIVTNR